MNHIGKIIGSILGVAVVLLGAYIAGFQWHRGFEGVMVYLMTIMGLVFGLTVGGVADS